MRKALMQFSISAALPAARCAYRIRIADAHLRFRMIKLWSIHEDIPSEFISRDKLSLE
jgi:hypothetical protein